METLMQQNQEILQHAHHKQRAFLERRTNESGLKGGGGYESKVTERKNALGWLTLTKFSIVELTFYENPRRMKQFECYC